MCPPASVSVSENWVLRLTGEMRGLLLAFVAVGFLSVAAASALEGEHPSTPPLHSGDAAEDNTGVKFLTDDNYRVQSLSCVVAFVGWV